MLKDSYKLFAALIITHLSIVPMCLYASAEEFAIAFLIYFLSAGWGMSVYVHRYLCHLSWEPNRFFHFFGHLCALYGVTGSPLAWASIHRQHHRHTDTAEDPHSPKHMGLLRAHFLSMMSKPKLSLVKDLMSDPYLCFSHRHYWKIQAFFVFVLFLLDPFAIIYAYLFPAMLVWNGGSSIISICHKWGYTNFKAKDLSKNNLLLGFLMWGEGWHQNHHINPTAWHFGVKWYELDVGALVVILFRKRSFRRMHASVPQPSQSGILS